MIDNDVNRNIKISNGKVIDDGSKAIVIGIALPGLGESLGIPSDKFDIPSGFEITMESTDFKLGNLMTFASSKLIEDSDVELFDNLDEIYSKANTLQSSGKQLEDGAKTLSSGAKTYVEKYGEFSDGMKEVADGANSAYENYSKIDDGIDTLYNSTGTLVSGAKQVSDGVKTANSAISHLSAGASRLETEVNKLTGQDAIKAVAAQLKEAKGKANEGIKQLTLLEQGYTKTIQDLTTKRDNATDEQTKTLLQNQIDMYTGLKTNMTTAKTALQEQVGYYETLETALSSGNTGSLAELTKGVSDLSSNLSQLASKSKTLESGAKSLYDGANKLSGGVNTLHSGSKEMKKGLGTLSDGTSKLYNANTQLADGARTIADGANTLSDGMSKFNKEGIETICNLVNGDLKDVSSRFEKLQELANEYNNFSNKDSSVDRKC